MRGPAGLGIKLTHSAPRRRAEARSRGCLRRSGASSWWRSPGTATRPATTSPAWTRSTSCWTTGAQGLPPAGALPDRADSPPTVGGRPGRSAGRRAAAGGARLDGACHKAAPQPSQNSYSHFAGGAAPERPAGRRDCSDMGTGRRGRALPGTGGATVDAGYWVLGQDARDGDRGSRRKGWPTGTSTRTMCISS
jgi:hypothetical protein